MSQTNSIVRFCAIALLALSAAALGGSVGSTAMRQTLASRTPTGQQPISIDTHISGYLVALG